MPPTTTMRQNPTPTTYPETPYQQREHNLPPAPNRQVHFSLNRNVADPHPLFELPATATKHWAVASYIFFATR